MAPESLAGPPPKGESSTRPNLIYQIADTRRDRLSAFKLVYDKYRQAELIPPNEHQIRVTPFHLLPTTKLFVATDRTRVVCTVTLIGDGALGLPMESIYPEEVGTRRRQNMYVGEVSCLAFEPMAMSRFVVVFVQLTRLMAQHARIHGMEQFLIAVHPQHVRFYERFMGFEQIGPLRNYTAVCDAPAIACCLDFSRIDRDRPRCYSEYFGTRLSAEQLISRPMTDDELCLFRPIADQSQVVLPHLRTFAEWYGPSAADPAVKRSAPAGRG